MACGGGVTTGDPGDELDGAADASTEAFRAVGSGFGDAGAAGRLCPVVAGHSGSWRRCHQAQWHLVTSMSSKSVETSLPSLL